MQVEAQIREWTRRLLMERGHERNSVEGFLQSGEFRGAMHMLSDWVFECEAGFREDWGNKLLDLFTQWNNKRGRYMDDSLAERLGRRRELQDHTSRDSSVRIPLDWLPEPQQREAERFLQYLQSKTRESVDAYLNALARAVGGSESDGVEYLLNLLQSSPCVDYYQGEGSLYLTSIEQLSEWQEKYYRRKPPDDLDLKSLRERGFFYPDVDAMLLLWEAQLDWMNALGFYKGILYGNRVYPKVDYPYGETVILPSRTRCKKCEVCFVMSMLLHLLNTLRESLRLWTYDEVCCFAFKRLPLPYIVGEVDTLTRIGNVYPFAGYDWGEDVLVIDTDDNQIQEQVEGFYENHMERILCYGTPLVNWTILPFLSQESYEALLKRLLPEVGGRAWGLHIHTEKTIRGSRRRSGWSKDTTLPRGALDTLLTDWNRHAPPEWRYETASARVNFCRALRNARRAIDGVKE